MKYTLPAVFLIVAIACVWLLIGPSPFKNESGGGAPQTKVISPQSDGEGTSNADDGTVERLAYEDDAVAKVALAEGEVAVSVVTQDFDGDPQDEQIVAYRHSSENDGPVYLSYIDFDELTGGYKRVWSAPTAATRPRTFTVYIKDLIGDRSICVIASGMNGAGEQTLTVFRKRPTDETEGEPFERIAELRTDGSATVLEKDRSQAYQLGLAEGESFRIATYGRDFESSNMLDQIETQYSYDPTTRRYERVGTARIPGTQIEQRRVRELLDGSPNKFEQFLDGLWYIAQDGSKDSEREYILFDTQHREIVFYADDTQEVFSWQNSNATRYGLYLSTQNISVTTLRRLVDIELESIDAIRVRVFEDVKLKIGVGGRWDGTYRKVSTEALSKVEKPDSKDREDITYEGSIGRLRLFANGKYELASDNGVTSGMYSFFSLNGMEMLEMRSKTSTTSARTTYRVKRAAPSTNAEKLILRKVRLGVGGLSELHEADIELSRVVPENATATPQ